MNSGLFMVASARTPNSWGVPCRRNARSALRAFASQAGRTARRKFAHMLFLDTEFFESRHGPRLLSVGIVSLTSEFYAELDESSFARLGGICKNRFLQSAVPPQFGRIADAQSTLVEMVRKTARWLRIQASETLQVAYDYSMDIQLLEDCWYSPTPPSPRNCSPFTWDICCDDPEGIAAAAAAWSAAPALRGLNRHHALADAFSLRARSEAVHSA